MKILIVFNHPAPYKVALFNGLNKYHDVHVIFERKKDRDRDELFYNEKTYKFTLHYIKGLNISYDNHLSWGVKKHLKHNKYDLIIMNGYSTFTEMITLRYLKKQNIPYVFYINGGIVPPKESRFKFKLKHYFISGAKYYLSPAKEANEYLLHYGAKENTIFEYPYSTIYENEIIKEKVEQKDKRLFWQEHNINASMFTICITSFIKRKNNLEVIQNWEQINNDHALILVGGGKEKKLYENYIKNHNLQNVFLLPFAKKEKVFEYLKHANNAVYLSNYDIYGHVINEALACGLNVLTNNNMIAARHLIVDGENGIIYNSNTSFKETIERLSNSDFFISAINTARNNTIEKSINRHIELLEKFK